MTTKFETMTSQELTSYWNTRVPDAVALGLTDFRPTNRFKDKAAGLRRIRELERAISEKKPVTRPKQTDPNKPTVAQKTATYNELVPEAHKLGITWPKHLVSNFEHHTAADRRLEKIRADITEAQAKA